jgi:uncharacterized small protein (DUF1192 family)
MAFETDDLEPLKKKSPPRNLDPMSVEELREYIAILTAEIARVEEKIKAKQSHASAAAMFFKK